MGSRDATIALVAILAALVLLPLFWMGGMMGPGMMGWRMGPQGWGGAGGLLIALLLFVGIGLIVAVIIRREGRPDDPLALLKLRLARGEITQEQFEELKKAIR